MKLFVCVILFLCVGNLIAQSEAEFYKEVEIYKTSQDKFCWKDSYGRGVGVIPTTCGNQEYDAGLCYPYCQPGYKGVGPVCWDFPKSYGRGVGTIPTSCQNNMQYDAGLCYKYCQAGYTGVGPVCWRSCQGSVAFDCGAACSSNGKACATAIFNMFKSVLTMIKNMATIIFSHSISTNDIATKKEAALQAAFDLAKVFHSKNYSRDAYINFMTKKAQQIGSAINTQTLTVIFDKASIIDKIRLDLEIIAQTDPTGIANVILAFLWDTC